jgi:hypothetical protein
MDIRWNAPRRFTTSQGVVEIEPLHIWKDVKLGEMRYSIEERSHVFDIEYQNCIFMAIPIGTFLILE